MEKGKKKKKQRDREKSLSFIYLLLFLFSHFNKWSSVVSLSSRLIFLAVSVLSCISAAAHMIEVNVDNFCASLNSSMSNTGTKKGRKSFLFFFFLPQSRGQQKKCSLTRCQPVAYDSNRLLDLIFRLRFRKWLCLNM